MAWLEMREAELAPLVAAQFAAGCGMNELAEEWELRGEQVEQMLRSEMLRLYPRRSGGTMPPRREMEADERIAENLELFG